MQSIRERIQQILDSLNTNLIERQEAMNLTFLSAIAGESIFLLGPPGVAKSLIARRLKFAFKGARSFEYLMHRFSTPDEVFGPISISKLKNEDKLERVVDYYLPGANVAFLDEIWKAGPSIQNTLLTILNEKIYRNGEQEFSVNLLGIIAASNELPAENQGLEALWDRFLLRRYVSSIQVRANFEKMITSVSDVYQDTLEETTKISLDEYRAWQTARDQVAIPQEILDLIQHIRVKIEVYNKEQTEKDDPGPTIYISDRRWKKIIKVLRTSAFLNGRQKIDLMDCFLIPSMIWDAPEQIDLVTLMVRESIRHQGYTLVVNSGEIQQAIEKLSREIESETQYVKIIKTNLLAKYYFKDHPEEKYYEISGIGKYCIINAAIFDSLRVGAQIGLRFHNHRDDSYNDRYITKVDEMSFSADGKQYTLKTNVKDQSEIFTKKPHELVIESWDKCIENFRLEIQNDLGKVDDYFERELKHIQENLFVDKSNLPIIFTKIEELKVQLRQMEIRCNELYEKYHTLQGDQFVTAKTVDVDTGKDEEGKLVEAKDEIEEDYRVKDQEEDDELFKI